MVEEPKPDPVPADEPPPHPAEPLQITTPVIQLDDKLAPTIDDRDLPVFPPEDLSAMAALEEFWKMIRTELPN